MSRLAKVTPDVEHITLQYYNINYNILESVYFFICMFTLSRHHFFQTSFIRVIIRFHGFLPVAHVSALSSSNTSPEAT